MADVPGGIWDKTVGVGARPGEPERRWCGGKERHGPHFVAESGTVCEGTRLPGPVPGYLDAVEVARLDERMKIVEAVIAWQVENDFERSPEWHQAMDSIINIIREGLR